METKPLSLPQIGSELPTTLEGCHSLIRELLQIIGEAFKRIEKLETLNRELRERVNTNSSNTSLPPSRDFKKKKKQAKAGNKNKGGGQKGHPGHYRELLSQDEVDVMINCQLPLVCSCGGEMNLKQEVQRHQVHELPEIKLRVTEYVLEKGYCLSCGRHHVAALPKGVSWGMTGPRLTAWMSDMVSRYELSRRQLKELLQEQYHFQLSLGSIFNKQKRVNAALEEPVAGLLGPLKQSTSVNMDETSHNHDGKREWLWAFVSPTIAFFSIATSRGKKALRSLMGDFKNIAISDRYAAYNYFDSSHRQLCWAHLKRDFTRLAEKEDPVLSRIGKNLLACEANLFKRWRAFKENHFTREELLRQVHPIRQRVGELLEQGSYTDPKLKVARFCKQLLEHFYALWTFLMVEGVEPTNNHAERCLRHPVIWRKKYFGTRSKYGSEFVARSMSVMMTCKLQSKNTLHFLTQVVEHYFLNLPAPPLIA